MRNLPAAPTILSTGVMMASADFIPWTTNRMVQVDASLPGFRVLELGPISGTVTTVTSPYALNAPPTDPYAGPRYAWGASAWGDFVGVGPGPDAQPGTSDDEFVMLRASGGGYQVVAHTLPPWVRPRGVAFNGAGTVALWNQEASPAISVSLVSAPPIGGLFPITTLVFSTGASPGICSGDFCMRVYGDPGDTFRAAVYDETAVDFCYRFIEDAGTAPSPGAIYCDDGQGFLSTLVADHSIARYSGIFGDQLAYTRFLPGGPQTFAAPLPTVPLGFAEPHPGSLLVRLDFGDALVIGDLLGANTMVTLPGSGHWLREPLVIGPGRIASFFDTTGLATGPDRLVLVSAPGSPVVGPSPSFPFGFEVSPAVPQVGQPLHLQVTALDPGYAGPAELFLTAELGEPLALTTPPFAPGTVVWLDITGPRLTFQIPLALGFGEVVVDTTPLPPSLSGIHLYGQAAFLDGAIGTVFVSDARLIVL